MKTINLPPYAPILIESTRAIGYSLETAIADVIDNSIAADANQVDIRFSPFADPYVFIIDDGKGMLNDELTSAMQYGSKSPSDTRSHSDLGRFGLGLKTASLSQCRVLTVISKVGDSITARRWDIDHIRETGEWSLLVLEEDNRSELPGYDLLLQKKSGTLVVWQRLDLMMPGKTNYEDTMAQKMDQVRDHIGLVFHRYLSSNSEGDRLDVTINNLMIDAIDPFLPKKSTQAMADETIKLGDQEIIVRPFILPHQSKITKRELASLGGKDGLRRNQGFYVYRNKRLIIWGTWFNMIPKGEMSKLVRIRVDVPNSLDHLWALDIKKSTATPPDEVKASLRTTIEQLALKSKRTYTYRGRKEKRAEVKHVWDRVKSVEGSVYYEINREYPLLTNMLERYPELKFEFDLILRHIERNMPIDQLYLDLNSDEKIENSDDIYREEIEENIEEILSVYVEKDNRVSMLEKLKGIEPFSNHIELINNYISREG